MGYLLDTDTCIWFLRQREPVYTRVQRESPDDLRIASMTLAELYYGALNSSDPAAAAARIDQFLGAGIGVLPFDEAAAAEHAAHRFALRAAPIGERDLVIASTATSTGHMLVTGNTREFERVPGLDVTRWS
ncbi:MAG: type II toxin-antitoxin system VapC family toxin [Gemmatimonadota bacterium]